MRAIPYDTSAAVVMCATEPRPRIKNAVTGEVDTDRETGAPLVNVGLVVTYDGRADVITAMVPDMGVPADLRVGSVVKVTGLVYRCGDKNGRRWEMFNARALTVTANGG
jgi:hypothetical protein